MVRKAASTRAGLSAFLTCTFPLVSAQKQFEARLDRLFPYEEIAEFGPIFWHTGVGALQCFASDRMFGVPLSRASPILLGAGLVSPPCEWLLGSIVSVVRLRGLKVKANS